MGALASLLALFVWIPNACRRWVDDKTLQFRTSLRKGWEVPRKWTTDSVRWGKEALGKRKRGGEEIVGKAKAKGGWVGGKLRERRERREKKRKEKERKEKEKKMEKEREKGKWVKRVWRGMGNGEKEEKEKVKRLDDESRRVVSEPYHSATRPQEGKGGKENVESSKTKTEEWLREKKDKIDSKREGL